MIDAEQLREIRGNIAKVFVHFSDGTPYSKAVDDVLAAIGIPPDLLAWCAEHQAEIQALRSGEAIVISRLVAENFFGPLNIAAPAPSAEKEGR